MSTLIYVQIAGTLAGGILWGNISHFMGNKSAVMISQLVGFGLNGLALFSIALRSDGVNYLISGCIVFLTGIYMGSWLGFFIYIIDLTTEEDRAVYLVINSVVVLPFMTLYYFAGLVASYLGYPVLFAIGTVFSIGAVILSLTLKSSQQIVALKEEREELFVKKEENYL